MATIDDLKRARWRMVRRIRCLNTFAKAELREGPATGLPLAKRAKWLLRGFFSKSAQTYRLTENNWREYVSDYTAYVRCGIAIHNLNSSRSTFENKARFADWCLTHNVTTPTILATVEPETFRAHDLQRMLDKAVSDVLKPNGQLIIKPILGFQGRGILLLSYAGDTLTINGNAWALSEREPLISEPCILTTYVEQDSYAKRIYPKTTNTIRILTIWDDEIDSPIIVAAAHRFGTDKSFPVDNWAKGGLTAWIDVESGIMSSALSSRAQYATHIHKIHPDTRCPIEGVIIPRWIDVKDLARNLAVRSHQIGNDYVGWDIVVTDNDISVIEANPIPGITIFQAHRPLYSASSMRRFFEQRAVLKQVHE